MQQFNCPYCGFLLMDDGRLAGSPVYCPRCNGVLLAPEPTPPPLPVISRPELNSISFFVSTPLNVQSDAAARNAKRRSARTRGVLATVAFMAFALAISAVLARRAIVDAPARQRPSNVGQTPSQRRTPDESLPSPRENVIKECIAAVTKKIETSDDAEAKRVAMTMLVFMGEHRRLPEPQRYEAELLRNILEQQGIAGPPASQTASWKVARELQAIPNPTDADFAVCLMLDEELGEIDLTDKTSAEVYILLTKLQQNSAMSQQSRLRVEQYRKRWLEANGR